MTVLLERCTLVPLILLITMLTVATEGIRNNRKPIRVLTYNTFMSDTADVVLGDLSLNTRPSRLKELISQFEEPKLNPDLVCLQEMYFGSDVATLTEELKMKYPYSFSSLHDNVDGTLRAATDPPCNNPLTASKQCIIANCSLPTTDENDFLSCLAANCSDPLVFEALIIGGQDCLTCARLELQNIAKFNQICLSVQELMNPTGLLVLSGKHLTDASFVEFHPGVPAIGKHGYITAKYSDAQDDVTVVCTHLSSANVPFVEPALGQLGFTNYTQLHFEETNILISDVKDTENVILTGDFNCGLNVTGVSGTNLIESLPGSYDLLTEYFNPTMKPLKKCTFCTDNKLYVSGTISVYDHVFTSNGLAAKNPKRVLDEETVQINSPSSPIPISDQYGVMACVYQYCPSNG